MYVCSTSCLTSLCPSGYLGTIDEIVRGFELIMQCSVVDSIIVQGLKLFINGKFGNCESQL